MVTMAVRSSGVRQPNIWARVVSDDAKSLRDWLIGLVVINDGARRYIDKEVMTPPPIFLPAHSALPVFGGEMLVELERQQTGDVVLDAQANVASAATIAAIRSAFGNVFLAAERHRSVPAIAGFYKDSSTINKHEVCSS